MLALFYIIIGVVMSLGFWHFAKLTSFKPSVKKGDGLDVQTEVTFVSTENPIATEKNNDIQGKLLMVFMGAFYDGFIVKFGVVFCRIP